MVLPNGANLWQGGFQFPLVDPSMSMERQGRIQYTSSFTTSHVSTFLQKLLAMVEDPACDHLIAWAPEGRSFRVHDPVNFAKEVLPRFFKHNNFSSFVRQLNMYDFHKVVDVQQGSLSNEQQEWEFANTNFKRGQLSLLSQVKRKAGSGDSTWPGSEALERMMRDMQTLQEEQAQAQRRLEQLDSNQEMMWGDMSKLKHHHQLQQQTVNRILYFLTSIYAPDRLNCGKGPMGPSTMDGSSHQEALGEPGADSIGDQPEAAALLSTPSFHQASEAESKRFFNSLGSLITSSEGRSPGLKPAGASVPRLGAVTSLPNIAPLPNMSNAPTQGHSGRRRQGVQCMGQAERRGGPE